MNRRFFKFRQSNRKSGRPGTQKPQRQNDSRASANSRQFSKISCFFFHRDDTSSNLTKVHHINLVRVTEWTIITVDKFYKLHFTNKLDSIYRRSSKSPTIMQIPKSQLTNQRYFPFPFSNTNTIIKIPTRPQKNHHISDWTLNLSHFQI